MFGDYFGIRRDYPVEEWMNDIVPQGVIKSVHVTAMWGTRPRTRRDPMAAIDRRQARISARHRVQCRSRRSRRRGGDRRRRSSSPTCAACATCSIGTAIRVRQGAPPTPDLCNDRDFRRGFALLEKYGLHFELQVYRRAGQIRRRIDQGVSERAHDPGACRHAHRRARRSDRANGAPRSRRWPRSPTCT